MSLATLLLWLGSLRSPITLRRPTIRFLVRFFQLPYGQAASAQRIQSDLSRPVSNFHKRPDLAPLLRRPSRAEEGWLTACKQRSAGFLRSNPKDGFIHFRDANSGNRG